MVVFDQERIPMDCQSGLDSSSLEECLATETVGSLAEVADSLAEWIGSYAVEAGIVVGVTAVLVYLRCFEWNIGCGPVQTLIAMDSAP